MHYWKIYSTLLVMLIVILGYIVWLNDNSFSSILHDISVIVFALFFPWYRISFLIFEEPEIIFFERCVISILLSCALIPFTFRLYLYFDWSITVLSSYLIIASIIFVSMLAVILKIDRN